MLVVNLCVEAGFERLVSEEVKTTVTARLMAPLEGRCDNCRTVVFAEAPDRPQEAALRAPVTNDPGVGLGSTSSATRPNE